MEGFEKFSLGKEIIDALNELKFSNPTEVQERAIPMVLQGKDIVVRSKTGSGKTAAFAIPIMQLLKHPRGACALIVAPTRELALQIEGVVRRVGKYTDIRTTVVYGGVSTRPQADRIRDGANVVVGTPGRIIDLMERGDLDLRGIKFLVLDEADIMLDMGFIDDIKYIIESTPESKQTMLFSATMPEKIKEIARGYMRNPVDIGVGGEEELAVNTVKNLYTVVDNSSKFSTLLGYLDHYKPRKSVIFSRTQRSADILHRILRDQGYTPVILHGGITQARREAAMGSFRRMDNGMLIATNVAARGIDIVDISDIINFDAPDEPTVYIHRIGRSARMGREGRAFTIFSRDQNGMVGAIERFAGVKLEKIEVDNRKFNRINYGEYIRRSREYGDRPRRFGSREGPRQRSNYGAHGSVERYGPRHGNDRSRERGSFRHRDRRNQSHFGPSL